MSRLKCPCLSTLRHAWAFQTLSDLFYVMYRLGVQGQSPSHCSHARKQGLHLVVSILQITFHPLLSAVLQVAFLLYLQLFCMSGSFTNLQRCSHRYSVYQVQPSNELNLSISLTLSLYLQGDHRYHKGRMDDCLGHQCPSVQQGQDCWVSCYLPAFPWNARGSG